MSLDRNLTMDRIHDMLIRAYMDAKHIPYQTVGPGNIELIGSYLLENKLMPYHCVPEFIAKRYGLVDNSPNIKEVEKETKRLQQLANEAISKLKDEDTAYNRTEALPNG